MHSIDHKFVAYLFVKECHIVAILRQNRIGNQFTNKNHLNRNHFDVFISVVAFAQTKLYDKYIAFVVAFVFKMFQIFNTTPTRTVNENYD